jgi:hypothetical protein
MISTTRLIGAAIACGVVAAVAACGGDSSSASVGAGGALPGGAVAAGQASSNLPDPCTLITQAQAEQAMGAAAAGPGKLQGGYTERVCKYDEGSNGAGSVTLTLNANADILKKVVNGSLTGAQSADVQQVSGLGDEALFAPGLEILFVRKGSVGFLVQVATVAIVQSRGSAKDIDVSLANGVLAKL